MLFAAGFGFWLSYQLRFDFHVPLNYQHQCFGLIPYIAGLKVLLFYVMRGHVTGWRYVGMRDMAFLAYYCAVCALILWSTWLLPLDVPIPRGAIVIDSLLGFVLFGSLRVSARFVREVILPGITRNRSNDEKKAIIIGAGDAGEMLMREMKRNPKSGFWVAAFFDDDPRKIGISIHGVRVHGPVDMARDFVDHGQVEAAIIAIPSANSFQIARIQGVFRDCDIEVKTLPRLHEMIEGSSALAQLRDIDITDLLGRQEIRIHTGQVNALIRGKSVLVTGAGGSIGSELCRQILKRKPGRLVLLERSENSLFHITRQLGDLPHNGYRPVLIPLLSDARSSENLHHELAKHRPSLVFHAAAHKHVAMQELNAVECFKNNVGGIQNLTSACDSIGVERFVFISTDKAVNPTSVMGATKRVCELYCQAMGKVSSTKFMSVRFGNVMASEGSAVPIFLEQIARGGPVTVTHPDVSRYFMTVSEAVALVLQAAALGESGDMMVLDMGEPVKIVDLVQQLIELAGKKEEEIPIVFTGLRQGEKLSEDLIGSGEVWAEARHDKIRRLQQSEADAHRTIAAINESVDSVFRNGHRSDIRRILRMLVPEYQPNWSLNTMPCIEVDLDEDAPADSVADVSVYESRPFYRATDQTNRVSMESPYDPDQRG